MEARVADAACEFDGFRLDRAGGGLFLHDGTPVPLGSRALDILQLLIERRGEVVTKERLLGTVWSGLVVEDKNLTVQVSALRRALDCGSGGASCIQTVPGQGYRFVSPVTWIDSSSLPSDASGERPVDDTPPSRGRQWVPAMATGVLIGGLALGGWIAVRDGGPARPAPPLSLAVLLFDDLGSEPQNDHLAEAITADLATDLARMRGSLVVRDSGAAAKTRPGVRYAVTGSVRRSGASVRVNAQLIGADTGVHLWADRFDQPLTDRGLAYDEIIQRLSQALRTALIDTESARSQHERPVDPNASDLLIRARSIGAHKMGWREHDARAELLERVLTADPRSIIALTALAEELIRRSKNREGDELPRAAELIDRAAAIDPNDPLVQSVAAYLLVGHERFVAAAAAYRRILHEHPDAIYALGQLGMCLTFTGRAQEAVPLIEASIKREPHSSYDWSRYDSLGLAMLLLGRDEEAIAWTQRALAALPNDYHVTRAHEYGRLAAAYARLGRLDKARGALRDAERSWPYDTVRSHWPDDPSSREYAEQVERLQAAMRLAGHRDHADENADFGAAPDAVIHADMAGPTPTTVLGAATIKTGQLVDLIAQENPVIVDALSYSWGRSLPSAVGLARAGWSSGNSELTLARLGRKMHTLTNGDLARPIVAVGFNSERFDGRNLALRLVALGYSHIYWYRGGREAWEVAGLPETATDVQDW